MNTNDHLFYLRGQINALMTFISAAIQTHHNPQSLMDTFQRSADRQAAVTLPEPLPESFVQGQQTMRDDIEALFRIGRDPSA